MVSLKLDISYNGLGVKDSYAMNRAVGRVPWGLGRLH